MDGSVLVILQKHQFGISMPQGGHPPHHSITSSARATSVVGQPVPVRVDGISAP
jgi:hypothetical protein